MEFEKKNPIIILIAGKARSGKNTISEWIKEEFLNDGKKVVVSPYTKYLKKYIEEITGISMDDENKPRDLLQQLSSKLIKKELHNSEFFLRRQIEDLRFYSYFMDVIIVPDVRFSEEIEEIRENFSNVVAIGVERKDYISTLTKEQQEDVTEVSLDDYQDYDYKIENTNELELKQKTLEILNEIKERR